MGYIRQRHGVVLRPAHSLWLTKYSGKRNSKATLVESDTATLRIPEHLEVMRVQLRYFQEHPGECELAFPQRGPDRDSDSSESEPEQEDGVLARSLSR
jgi:hypothetical protein